MSKTRSITVETITAPALTFVEGKQEKPQEFLTALKDYQRSVKNADRASAPLKFLTMQASYAYRIYSALKADGHTELYIKADENGQFIRLNVSRTTFGADYKNVIVPALFQAQNNGVIVAKTEQRTGKNGAEFVKISAEGGIIGVA